MRCFAWHRQLLAASGVAAAVVVVVVVVVELQEIEQHLVRALTVAF